MSAFAEAPAWGEPGYVDEPLGWQRPGGEDAAQEPAHSNLQAEAALIGGMLIDNRLIDQVADLVSPEDFAEPLHGRLFKAMVDAMVRGEKVNPITLRPLFDADPALQQMGGVSYLIDLTASFAGVIGGTDFARQIASLAKRRRLVEDLKAALANAMGDTPIADVAEAADAALTAVVMGESRVKPIIELAEIFDSSLSMIEAEARGEAPAGVQTQFLPDWNVITGGMRPGEVTVLGARPAMGKTATALSIALGAAALGHGVAFFSLEMRTDELGKRMISDLVFDYGNCPSFEDVKRGKFTQNDWRRVSDAQKQVRDWPLVVLDKAAQSVGRIAMMIRRVQRQMAAKGRALQLVVIDYLQLVKADRDRKSRYEEVGEISRTLKQVARDCGVHILLLAQVNRECEKREDKRPQPFDLRDAGDIEQDADTIAFLFREEVYLKAAEPAPEKSGREAWETKLEAARDRIEIYTAKRRNGETMRRTCWFFGANQAVRGSRYFEERGR